MNATAQSGYVLDGEPSKLVPMFRSLWASRVLIRLLARKSFLVQYRRASLGLLWSIGLPMVQAAVMSFIIGRIARFDTDPVPFAAFVLTGVVPWTFFLSAVTNATTSIVDGSTIATKIYFPRAILPIVTVLAGIRGLVPALVVGVSAAAILGAPIGLSLLWLFPAMAMLFLLATGFAMILAGMYVYFRDMRFIVAAGTIPWAWASGIFYPLSVLGPFRQWVELNPAVGMLQLFRLSVGHSPPGWERAAGITVIWVVVLIAASLPLYRRYDRVFVDLL